MTFWALSLRSFKAVINASTRRLCAALSNTSRFVSSALTCIVVINKPRSKAFGTSSATSVPSSIASDISINPAARYLIKYSCKLSQRWRLKKLPLRIASSHTSRLRSLAAEIMPDPADHIATFSSFDLSRLVSTEIADAAA